MSGKRESRKPLDFVREEVTFSSDSLVELLSIDLSAYKENDLKLSEVASDIKTAFNSASKSYSELITRLVANGNSAEANQSKLDKVSLRMKTNSFLCKINEMLSEIDIDAVSTVANSVRDEDLINLEKSANKPDIKKGKRGFLDLQTTAQTSHYFVLV